MNYVKYLSIPNKHLGADFSGCDCFGLVKLIYKNEFNVTLPDCDDYAKNWELTDAKKILRLYTKFGFKKVPDTKFGDVILINESNYPKHLGVVINDGYFLHTLESGTFCHSYLVGVYSQIIHSVFRYKRGLIC